MALEKSKWDPWASLCKKYIDWEKNLSKATVLIEEQDGKCTYKFNIEAGSSNHSYRGQAVSTQCYECLYP
jgi:hypothetical protein